MSHDAPPPRLAPDLTLVDLRDAAQRRADPLPGGRRVLALGLEEIEDGAHGLTPGSGPVLVVCARGTHSQLAARYLRADGLDAQAWPGDWASFRASLAAALREG